MTEKYNDIMFKVGLLNHVQYNLYPPLPAFVVDAAGDAIAAVNDDNGDKDIRFPLLDDETGSAYVQAWQIVENLHLEGFLSGVIS